MRRYRFLSVLFLTALGIAACNFHRAEVASATGGTNIMSTGGAGGYGGRGTPRGTGGFTNAPSGTLTSDAGTGVCGPAACASQGKNCGPVIDGCGDVVQCGTCAASECCGCGGVPSVCAVGAGTKGSSPAQGGACTTCASLGKNCGPVADGCGNLIECGTCTAPQCCGCGGVPSVCGGGASSTPGMDGGVPPTVATTCIAGSKGCLCDSQGACTVGLTCQPQAASKPRLCCDGTDCGAATTNIGGSCAPVTIAASCTPGVTVPPAGASLDNCGYPTSSFNESSIMCGIVAQGGGTQPAQIQAYYNDEHALTLGCATTALPVSPLPGSPGAVYYPQLGDPTCNDPSGRPIRPSLFITDITADPNCTSGDQQNGGAAYDPVAVFGTWKISGVAADPTTNKWTLGSGADVVPGSVTSNSKCNLAFGSEVRYEAGLISGHSYRLQVMFHDGDRAADTGEACAIFCAGTGICTPMTTCGSEVCGLQPDGCGGMIDCPCCTPTTCGAQACGMQADGCGRSINCGSCCTPQTCGTTACGQQADGCGGLLTCGPPCPKIG